MNKTISTPQRHAFGIICIVACALVACHVLWLPRIVIDDAYISFRYAHNLADGQGLVFNPHQRVEGFSNFLWVLIIAAGMIQHLDPVAWSRSLGIAALFGAVCIAIDLARRLTQSNKAALAVAIILAASTALCASSISGLETGLFTLLLTAAVASTIAQRNLAASTLMGLAAITRPEGAGLCLIAVTVTILIRRDPQRWRHARQLLLPCAATVTALLIFRQIYYGHWLPNSVIAKSTLLSLLKQNPPTDWPGLLFNQPGMRYCLRFLNDTFGPVILFASLPILLIKPPNRWIAFYLLATIAMGISVALSNFGDWMASFRLLTPYLPILTVLVVWGMAESLNWLRGKGPHPWTTPLRMALALLALVSAARQFQRHRPPIAANPDPEIAAALNASHQPALLAATDVLGRLSYFADHVNVLDMAGLTDEYIARHGTPKPPFGRSDFQYVLARRPHFIMTNVRDAWRRRLAHAQLARRYWWVDRSQWTRPTGPVKQPRFVLVRRGSMLAAEFRIRYPDAIFRPAADILLPDHTRLPLRVNPLRNHNTRLPLRVKPPTPPLRKIVPLVHLPSP